MAKIVFEADGVEMPALDREMVGRWLAAVAGGMGKTVGTLTYIFCNDEKILQVNKEFLKHDYYTDIITFDYSTRRRIAGDMFISLDTVRTNAELFGYLDRHRIPGIKLFMGSSTGNMLVDRKEALDKIFTTAPVPVMAHCEDTGIINDNMRKAKEAFGDDPSIEHHPEIRSEEACYRSTELAVRLAKQHGARLHVAHVTTARELSLFEPWTDTMPKITAEAVIAHLFFSDEDYTRLGSLIKCNPAIKSTTDREALRKALTDGKITVIGTDHAPHLPADKQGGCSRAASGMPMVQFSLVAMLELVSKGVLTIERVAELMCHRPAMLFDVFQRGFIRKGYKADLTIVRPDSPWTVTEGCIQSKCGWSPMQGHTFDWRVEHTFCNGKHIYDNGRFDASCRGEEVVFRQE